MVFQPQRGGLYSPCPGPLDCANSLHRSMPPSCTPHRPTGSAFQARLQLGQPSVLAWLLPGAGWRSRSASLPWPPWGVPTLPRHSLFSRRLLKGFREHTHWVTLLFCSNPSSHGDKGYRWPHVLCSPGATPISPQSPLPLGYSITSTLASLPLELPSIFPPQDLCTCWVRSRRGSCVSFARSLLKCYLVILLPHNPRLP